MIGGTHQKPVISPLELKPQPWETLNITSEKGKRTKIKGGRKEKVPLKDKFSTVRRVPETKIYGRYSKILSLT